MSRPASSTNICPVCTNAACACVNSPDPRSFNPSQPHAEFLQALEAFDRSAAQLHETWQQLTAQRYTVADNNTYPFAPNSFDELTIDISEWREAIQQNWLGKLTAETA